jgi:hypothetical protein
LSPPVDEDALDVDFAKMALATPSHYPEYRGIPLAELVPMIRAARLRALANTQTPKAKRA